MTLEHKKPPGRKKYQSAKALDPTNDFWANIDVNTFGIWANHPLRTLATKVATIRLQQDSDKTGGTTKSREWLRIKIEELKKEMGIQMTEMALQGRVLYDQSQTNTGWLVIPLDGSGGRTPQRAKT